MPYTDRPSDFASPRLFPYNDEGEPLMTDAQYRFANSLDDERDFDEENYWKNYRDDESDTYCNTCDGDPCCCPDAPKGGSFALFSEQGQSSHPTKDDAIAYARKAGSESFEIYDADDRQVFCERPSPRWA